VTRRRAVPERSVVGVALGVATRRTRETSRAVAGSRPRAGLRAHLAENRVRGNQGTVVGGGVARGRSTALRDDVKLFTSEQQPCGGLPHMTWAFMLERSGAPRRDRHPDRDRQEVHRRRRGGPRGPGGLLALFSCSSCRGVLCRFLATPSKREQVAVTFEEAPVESAHKTPDEHSTKTRSRMIGVAIRARGTKGPSGGPARPSSHVKARALNLAEHAPRPVVTTHPPPNTSKPNDYRTSPHPLRGNFGLARSSSAGTA